MPSRRFDSARRGTALLALVALVAVGAVSTAAGGEAGDERCLSCAGCETGACRESGGSPLGSHHHCCATSCMSHTVVTLPAAPATLAPETVAPWTDSIARLPSRGSHEPPYRPPRD
jgi:hypothetical protein